MYNKDTLFKMKQNCGGIRESQRELCLNNRAVYESITELEVKGQDPNVSKNSMASTHLPVHTDSLQTGASTK